MVSGPPPCLAGECDWRGLDDCECVCRDLVRKSRVFFIVYFDLFYNPGLVRQRPSGWGAVLIAIFTLLIGTVALMFGIAMIVIYVWTALGWLDGFDLNAD